MRPALAPPPVGRLEAGPVPTFSVVIGAYQAAATIGEAVASALEQTAAPHEVVVCDDGSTDDIEGALAPYRDRIVLVRKENGGGASALNAAIRAATGDFVSVLDADDSYQGERIEALRELAAARPDLDILMTDSYLEVDGLRVGRFCAETPFAADDQRVAILDRCFISWPAVRRSRLLAVGGYDESLRIAYDWDCYLRLVFAGARAGLVDVPLHAYRLSSESLSGNRAPALRERVTVLEKAERQLDLTREERRALRASLLGKRARALLTELEAALGEQSRDARRLAMRTAVRPGLPVKSRLQAGLAALSPRTAARRLEKHEARTGHSRLERSIPRG